MPLNQGNLASSLANIIATYELTPEDKSLVVMPLFHVHGLMAGQTPIFHILLTHSHQGRLFLGQTMPRADCAQGRLFPGQNLPKADCFQGKLFPGLYMIMQHSCQSSSLSIAACSLYHCKSPTSHGHNHHASLCLMTA